MRDTAVTRLPVYPTFIDTPLPSLLIMFFAYATSALLGVFAALANAAPASDANTKCHTIDSGYLSAFIGLNNGHNEAFDLNSDKELTFGKGKAIKAVFQACPKIDNVSFNSAGRIVLEPISSNKCLTVTNPSSSGPYYVKAEKCTSNTEPSAAQTWGFGNDFGDVIFYTGSKACDGGAGVSMESNGKPKLASRDRVELSCEGTFESFTLTKNKD